MVYKKLRGPGGSAVIRQLREENPDWTQQEIADEAGCSQPYVNEVISKTCDSQDSPITPPFKSDRDRADFRKLPSELQDKVREKDISLNAACIEAGIRKQYTHAEKNAAEWTSKYSKGRTDADFAELIGSSQVIVNTRRRVHEAFYNLSYKLSFTHYREALPWHEADPDDARCTAQQNPVIYAASHSHSENIIHRVGYLLRVSSCWECDSPHGGCPFGEMQ